MRNLTLYISFTVLLIACKENARDKAAVFYKANEKALSKKREVNNFILQLAYMPEAAMSQGDNKSTGGEAGYYHFRLQVQCPLNAAQSQGDKTALYYGLDTLFSGGGSSAGIYPISVQPITTGSSRLFEYLLVFAKKDLKKDKQLEIIFFDRLFTNTKMSFVFDRKKIDEIDLLHS